MGSLVRPDGPANFTPDMGGYSGTEPFRFWCQKVLPLVYDDSLSYYELLCKVVDYLNKTIGDVATAETNITALLEAYEQLQNWTNEYFESLDVQIEINNKLDAMAKDGSLGALLSQYLGPTFSPIVVDSVEEMKDKNRLYILSSSGSLYYYKDGHFVTSAIHYTGVNDAQIGFVWANVDGISYDTETRELHFAREVEMITPAGDIESFNTADKTYSVILKNASDSDYGHNVGLIYFNKTEQEFFVSYGAFLPVSRNVWLVGHYYWRSAEDVDIWLNGWTFSTSKYRKNWNAPQWSICNLNATESAIATYDFITKTITLPTMFFTYNNKFITCNTTTESGTSSVPNKVDCTDLFADETSSDTNRYCYLVYNADAQKVEIAKIHGGTGLDHIYGNLCIIGTVALRTGTSLFSCNLNGWGPVTVLFYGEVYGRVLNIDNNTGAIFRYYTGDAPTSSSNYIDVIYGTASGTFAHRWYLTDFLYHEDLPVEKDLVLKNTAWVIGGPGLANMPRKASLLFANPIDYTFETVVPTDDTTKYNNWVYLGWANKYACYINGLGFLDIGRHSAISKNIPHGDFKVSYRNGWALQDPDTHTKITMTFPSGSAMSIPAVATVSSDPIEVDLNDFNTRCGIINFYPAADNPYNNLENYPTNPPVKVIDYSKSNKGDYSEQYVPFGYIYNGNIHIKGSPMLYARSPMNSLEWVDFEACCFGDSITAGTGTNIPWHYWVTMHGNIVCRNFGISGIDYYATLSGSHITGTGNIGDGVAMEHTDTNMLSWIKENKDNIKPYSAIVLAAGTNDWSNKSTTKEQFLGAVRECIQYCLDTFVGNPVIVMTPIHRKTETNDTGTLKEWVEAMIDLCHEMGVGVIDMYNNCQLHPEIASWREKYIPDGLHPNEAGDMIMGKIANHHLMQFLGDSKRW